MIRVLSVVFALTAVPALAQAPLPPAAPCLRPFQVHDFRQLDSHDMIVVADTHRTYRVSFLDTCPEVSSYSSLIIKTFRPGKLACVSRGDHVLVKNYGGPADRCTVAAVDYYGPQNPRD